MYSGVLLEFLNMGGGEVMLIMVVVLLLFGGKKLPELARGLGKGIREFKDASEGVKREIHRNINNVDLDKEIEEEDAKEDAKAKELGEANAEENHSEENHAERHHPSSDDAPIQSIVEEEHETIVKESTTKKPRTKKNKETDL
jgi:sec-independent protein translocase protein TatA